ncbi:hypothetical protein [Bradyrhizobium mercantei]|uniref:hypothetical protein n=1 Tax=Bradyrhizobium mercantei TaxID=1904807 RepID=UPI0009776863|nr:hypothetical protein [Bradyrhizobium mercantei]
MTKTTKKANTKSTKAVSNDKSVKKAGRKSSMALGRGWRISPDSGKTEFAATLVATYDVDGQRLAVFTSPR